MEPKDLWQLFAATGDPVAYMLFKAVDEEESGLPKEDPRASAPAAPPEARGPLHAETRGEKGVQ